MAGMHDDDEKRFPRTTLWQFLEGTLRPTIRFVLLGPLALIGSFFGGETERRKTPDGEKRPPDGP
ncbi:hypothetical protein [Salinarimonas soli]|uniref:Uncharacterized protein n=1 Tax=Salinarimonas soli TaxID=1638099 RepID=A0A5B2VFQ5_9HYPH|nr:hypothetical protein [Salinarimonas soli]KAA2237436.1 hypothetical protein F0L46_10600 [Salinarimonas soli]